MLTRRSDLCGGTHKLRRPARIRSAIWNSAAPFEDCGSAPRRQPPPRPASAEAYTELAGLFVGNGIVDDDLIGVLLDPSVVRDDALLALAAGRRAEALGRLDGAIADFADAISAARAAVVPEVLAHAAHDRARALFTRNHPGDVDECLRMLAMAHESARERGMETLCTQIEQLELGVRADDSRSAPRGSSCQGVRMRGPSSVTRP